LEIIGNGGLATLDNFQKLTIAQNGRKRIWRSILPDKGYCVAVKSFLHAVRHGV
jgi:hypothetical protein